MKLLVACAAAVAMLLLPASSAIAAPVEPAAVPGELLVKFKPGTPRKDRADVVAARRGRIFATIPGLDIDAVEFAELEGSGRGPETRAKARDLERDPRVQFAEPNFLYTATFTPNDPGLGQQWAWAKIQAFSAWDVTRDGSATTIAIVDTGIQRSHPDLDAKIVAGTDFVDGDSDPDDGNGHGTHVAGTAAAETDNATGGAGTCLNCRLMPVRVLNNSGSGSLLNVANGIRWAADNGAKAINLSLGGPGSSSLQSAVDYAAGKDAFLACSAGNDNTSSTTNAYPAAYANCFAVASTTSGDVRSSFSNYGSWVEAAAPGSGIYSTWLSGGYNTISGTSMATPHVAGLGGILASQGLAAAQIRSRICSTADAIAGTGTFWTCGRINANRAVTVGAVFTNPTARQTNWDSTQQFTWTAAPGAQGYYLLVGTSPGGYDLVFAGMLPPSQTSYASPVLPSGQTLYARIYTAVGGVWSWQDITFTASAQGTAAFTNPTAGQTDWDSTQLFMWSTVPGAQGYYLVVGTSPGGSDLVWSGFLPPSQTSYAAPDLPSGQTLYARIYTGVGGSWPWQDITFTASAAQGKALFTHPIDGQTNVNPTQPITWSAIPAAQGHWLIVGTSPGGYDVVNSGVLPADQTSYSGPALPTGRTLYARIYTVVNYSWNRYQAISFST